MKTRGTGAEARTTWKSYYKSGAAKGRVKSELSPDGSWTMYAYDATGRVAFVVAPFGEGKKSNFFSNTPFTADEINDILFSLFGTRGCGAIG